jgi:hypothetical protein
MVLNFWAHFGAHFRGLVKDLQQGAVLLADQAQRLLEPGRLGVSQVRLIQAVEEVHDGKHGEQAQVELRNQAALGYVIGGDQIVQNK